MVFAAGDADDKATSNAGPSSALKSFGALAALGRKEAGVYKGVA